jgi:hypothetical protein
MLFQVGGQGSRPTFFEMAAAQQLPASLRAALSYSVGVLALRRPFLHRFLDYEDESFAFLMLLLESHSLRTTGLSSTQSLFPSTFSSSITYSSFIPLLFFHQTLLSPNLSTAFEEDLRTSAPTTTKTPTACAAASEFFPSFFWCLCNPNYFFLKSSNLTVIVIYTQT